MWGHRVPGVAAAGILCDGAGGRTHQRSRRWRAGVQAGKHRIDRPIRRRSATPFQPDHRCGDLVSARGTQAEPSATRPWQLSSGSGSLGCLLGEELVPGRLRPQGGNVSRMVRAAGSGAGPREQWLPFSLPAVAAPSEAHPRPIRQWQRAEVDHRVAQQGRNPTDLTVAPLQTRSPSGNGRPPRSIRTWQGRVGFPSSGIPSRQR